MKKIDKTVPTMMFTMSISGISITVATTENPDGRAVMNPRDDIFQSGECAQFPPRNSGITPYRADKIDVVKDSIHNNKLKT